MKKYLLALMFVCGPLGASAEELTQLGLLARCYAHLTGRPLPLNHPLRNQVIAGTVTAKAACEGLIDKVQLSASSGYLTADDAETRAILQNFNNFHRSWFPGNVVEGIQEYGLETSRGMTDIYDSTEPGLAITRAAFAEDGRYSDILTMPSGVHALRQQTESIRAMFGWNVTFPGRRLFGNSAEFDQNIFHFTAIGAPFFELNSDITTYSTFMQLPRIEVGELAGIRKTTESFVIPNVSLYPLGAFVPGSTVPGLVYSFNMYQTFGGGVLGTPIYFMLNYGHGRGLMSNGTTKVPRRWAQTNMTTFMCANLPALRESDITQFYVGNSTAPFRNGTSCLRCHANLDQMAYTARNLITAGTDFTEFAKGSRVNTKSSMVLVPFAVDAGAVAGWPSEPVANFHRTSPTGRLYFRSFASGELVNVPVNNMSELGAAMTNTDDFYQCAAKRYFAYFTGIQVSLFDRRDPANATLNKNSTEADLKDRAFIEDLAAELKKTQSVKTLIKRIIDSDYYSSENYRP